MYVRVCVRSSTPLKTEGNIKKTLLRSTSSERRRMILFAFPPPPSYKVANNRKNLKKKFLMPVKKKKKIGRAANTCFIYTHLGCSSLGCAVISAESAVLLGERGPSSQQPLPGILFDLTSWSALTSSACHHTNLCAGHPPCTVVRGES